MAEQRRVREATDGERPARESSRHRASDDRDRRPRPESGRRSDELTAAQAASAGLRLISELTRKPLEGVTGVERSDDGWVVGVEVVEDRRIPSSTDVLAIYEAELDGLGELVSYRRLKRYSRGRGDAGEDA